jgi:hypothetical protein
LDRHAADSDTQYAAVVEFYILANALSLSRISPIGRWLGSLTPAIVECDQHAALLP